MQFTIRIYEQHKYTTRAKCRVFHFRAGGTHGNHKALMTYDSTNPIISNVLFFSDIVAY